MEFHEKLRQLRLQKGLTQEALAQSLFVSRTAISKWESGRGCPSIDSIKQISAFFNVSIDTLLTEEGETLLPKKNRPWERYVMGLTDLSAALALLLPLFRVKTAAGVQAVSLLGLSEAAGYLQIAFWAVGVWSSLAGILHLALPWERWPFWQRNRRRLSLLTSAAGVMLFVISTQPYAALYLFVGLLVKVFFLMKKP